MKKKKTTKNRKIDQKKTKQVVIDKGYHVLIKKKAADAGESIKTLLEGYIANILIDETTGNKIKS